jgi:putative colanic acid biosynthesis acetyltransferase WcaF
MPDSKSISKVKLTDFDPSDGLQRGVSKSTEVIWYLVKMMFFLTAIPFPSKLKVFLLNRFGAKVGRNVNIKPRVNIHMPWKLEIGDHSWIGEEVFILNFERLKIGKNVCISQRVFLCGGNHDYYDPAFKYRNGPITIQDGAWIGTGCFIGPNVDVGVDTVVTAGSVVTSDLNANGIYKGNPAIWLKTRWND